MRDETRLWLQQAEEDLETARLNMGLSRFYVVAEFAQQAAEKALNALHIDRAAELPPKSHDL